jgi:hypothetical protein
VLQLGNVFPHADAEACQERCAYARRLQFGGTIHRNAKLIGLHLAQQIVRCGSSVDGETFKLDAPFLRHQVDDVSNFVRDRLECGPRDVGSGCPSGDSHDESARPWIPIGCAEAGESGNENHAG